MEKSFAITVIETLSFSVSSSFDNPRNNLSLLIPLNLKTEQNVNLYSSIKASFPLNFILTAKKIIYSKNQICKFFRRIKYLKISIPVVTKTPQDKTIIQLIKSIPFV